MTGAPFHSDRPPNSILLLDPKKSSFWNCSLVDLLACHVKSAAILGVLWALFKTFFHGAGCPASPQDMLGIRDIALNQLWGSCGWQGKQRTPVCRYMSKQTSLQCGCIYMHSPSVCSAYLAFMECLLYTIWSAAFSSHLIFTLPLSCI